MSTQVLIHLIPLHCPNTRDPEGHWSLSSAATDAMLHASLQLHFSGLTIGGTIGHCHVLSPYQAGTVHLRVSSKDTVEKCSWNSRKSSHRTETTDSGFIPKGFTSNFTQPKSHLHCTHLETTKKVNFVPLVICQFYFIF